MIILLYIIFLHLIKRTQPVLMQGRGLFSKNTFDQILKQTNYSKKT